MKLISGVILVFLTTSAHAGLFGPSNYEECILENMKGVQSDVAAYQITKACRRQFPLPAKTGLFDDLLPKQQKASEPNFFDRFDQDRSENKSRPVK